MAKQKTITKRSFLLRIGTAFALLLVAGWILVSHRHIVMHGLRIARHAQAGWLGLSLGLMAATFFLAAAIYGTLALHLLRFRQTALVEIATAFVNRLLPSGLGGLGLHGLYLYRRKHSIAEATAVVSVNNLVGIVSHLLMLAVALLFYPGEFQHLLGDGHRRAGLLSMLGLVLAVGIASLPVVRRRLLRFGTNLLKSVRKITLRKVLQACAMAIVLTTTYTCILFSVSRALNISLGLVQVFIIFSLGMLAGTATPTPGGLVGAEAGLFAGFVAYGVSEPVAAAAVLLYRLVTYWVPLIPGLLALLVARRQELV